MPSLPLRVLNRRAIVATATIVALVVGSPLACRAQPAQSTPKPAAADCYQAAYSFSPADETALRTIIACAKSPAEAAAVIGRLTKAALATSQARRAMVIQQTDNKPVAYLVNGTLVAPAAWQANATGFGTSPAAVPLTADQIAPAMTYLLKQGQQANAGIAAFNASSAASTAASNEAVRQAGQLNGGHCAFRTNSISAATGLVSLASNAAVYTRAQLGILSLIAPIIFSRCENVTPPAKPAPALSASTLDKTAPVTLTVSEIGYTGTFTVTASAPSVIVVAPVAGSKPVQFTLSVVSSFTGSIPLTLTVTDELGQSSIIALNVNG
jgi:hypothetical protein